jgi:hypothetical protein
MQQAVRDYMFELMRYQRVGGRELWSCMPLNIGGRFHSVVSFGMVFKLITAGVKPASHKQYFLNR